MAKKVKSKAQRLAEKRREVARHRHEVKEVFPSVIVRADGSRVEFGPKFYGGGQQEPIADADLVDLARTFEIKAQELERYYMTHNLEEDLSNEPPKNAEYLAQLLLPSANREALLGDLVEEYPGVVAKYGVRRAKFSFYLHVVFSILVLARNAVVKWGLFGWVVELIRRIGS